MLTRLRQAKMTTNKSKGAREFFIYKKLRGGYWQAIEENNVDGGKPHSSWHVIEKSAYDQALARIAELEIRIANQQVTYNKMFNVIDHLVKGRDQLRESLKEAVNALEEISDVICKPISMTDAENQLYDTEQGIEKTMARLRERHPEVFE